MLVNMAIAREILSIPLASILLCIIAYEIGTWINKKTGISVLHPLPVAIAIVIFVLAVCKVDYQTFNAGGQFVTMFVGPATVCLAVPLYKNVQKLKRNLIPILVATTVGSITSIVLAVLMG
jgi:putative effector of murein hydrolase